MFTVLYLLCRQTMTLYLKRKLAMEMILSESMSGISEKENTTEAFFNLTHAVFTVNSLYRHGGNNTSTPGWPITVLLFEHVVSHPQGVVICLMLRTDCCLSAENNVRGGMSLEKCWRQDLWQVFITTIVLIHCPLSVTHECIYTHSSEWPVHITR